jgi:hypothetical protein
MDRARVRQIHSGIDAMVLQFVEFGANPQNSSKNSYQPQSRSIPDCRGDSSCWTAITAMSHVVTPTSQYYPNWVSLDS